MTNNSGNFYQFYHQTSSTDSQGVFYFASNVGTVFFLGASALTIAVPLSMFTNKITNMADPTSLQDAATKNYVDNISVASGKITCTANTTTTLAASTDTILNAFTASSFLINFTLPSNNTITYTGLPSRNVCINFTFTMSLSVAATTFKIIIYKNGSSAIATFIEAPVALGATNVYSMSTIVSAATNDYFSIYANSNIATTITVVRGQVAIFAV